MEEERCSQGTHVLVLPYPLQGHINPMIQFSKRLASKGLKVTLIIASEKPSPAYQIHSINVETISTGSQEGDKKEERIEERIERFKLGVSQSLAEFIQEQKCSKHPPKALVYDSTLPWALDIARNSGLYAAPFFTQPWSVSAIYFHVHQGSYHVPAQAPDHPILASFPSFPLLSTKDLPSFVCESSSYPALLKLVVSQFSNFKQADYILCNTFDKLDDKVMKWMENQWSVKNIGPTIPSMFLDKRLQDDKDYGLSLFEPNVDDCMKWLDSKQTGSVVYVSFGSLVTLGEEQMKEVAMGLKLSGCYFLWVVRETEMNKLPSNYCEEALDKGLIVNWSCQLQVLAHKSVGCFMTHSGWNSTIEALSLGVPMIAMPQWTDQPTNAKFVADVWRVGIRVRADESGFVTKEEMVGCIKEIMEGERGKEIKRNSEKWKELAKEAVSEGGSSNRNIEELVTKLASG